VELAAGWGRHEEATTRPQHGLAPEVPGDAADLSIRRASFLDHSVKISSGEGTGVSAQCKKPPDPGPEKCLSRLNLEFGERKLEKMFDLSSCEAVGWPPVAEGAHSMHHGLIDERLDPLQGCSEPGLSTGHLNSG
jgi:hypothetical protein